MKNLSKERPSTEDSASKKRNKGKTVRGSGFTYTEAEKRTDQSVPVENADQTDIVKLPDLGQKNRP
jgi:hypothetical protein